jgi:lipoprotein-anchoring transpeptidase ErfK/SrfK
MRRHVENSEKESLGILALSLMWLAALIGLSAAAHGEEKTNQQVSQAMQAQQQSAAIAPIPAAKKDGSEHPAPVRPSIRMQRNNAAAQKPAATSGAPADELQTAETGEQVTLSRFILVSIPDRQLALVDDGKVVKIYPIAIGTERTPSPTGDFTIVSHVANPTWSHQGKTAPPGKNNPVGSRWMGLSLKGYGIHGTNVQSSVGKAASHGCFRMKKKDVEELFSLVRIGDAVAVRSERDELVAQVFGTTGANGEVQVASADVAGNGGVTQDRVIW